MSSKYIVLLSITKTKKNMVLVFGSEISAIINQTP